ncbi:MAG: DUF805 domain-containing protein [Gammaproteobacteria bacterium]|nr:DUF805 domain-containing protein [Gammaproteobacteria bacterium]
MNKFYPFRGALSREQFFFQYIVLVGAPCIMLYFSRSLNNWESRSLEVIIKGLELAVVAWCIFIMINLIIRRLQDLERSAWEILYLLIPIFNIFSIFELLFVERATSPNEVKQNPS